MTSFCKCTGTEDYFNTSWCPKTLFSHPYYGYARVNDSIGWLGQTQVCRFHISGPIYFDETLKFIIEHGHSNCLTLDQASVAYWYQAPSLTRLAPIPGMEERKTGEFIDTWQIHKWRHEWRKSKGGEGKLWGNE